MDARPQRGHQQPQFGFQRAVQVLAGVFATSACQGHGAQMMVRTPHFLWCPGSGWKTRRLPGHHGSVWRTPLKGRCGGGAGVVMSSSCGPVQRFPGIALPIPRQKLCRVSTESLEIILHLLPTLSGAWPRRQAAEVERGVANGVPGKRAFRRRRPLLRSLANSACRQKVLLSLGPIRTGFPEPWPWLSPLIQPGVKKIIFNIFRNVDKNYFQV